MSEVYSVLATMSGMQVPTGFTNRITREEGYRIVRSEDRLDVVVYYAGSQVARLPWAACTFALDYVEEPKTVPTGARK